MARGTTTQNLFLQISGSSSGLTAALREAKISMADVGQASADLQARVAANMTRMAPANAAKAIEANIRSQLRAIQDAARGDLGVNNGDALVRQQVRAAEQALAAARSSAAGLRELADAQNAYVAGAANATVAERGMAAGLEALAVSERGVVASREADVASLRGLAASMGVAVGATEEVAAAHRRGGVSGMMFQHVIRSTTDSFAAGLPPTMIFAEQIGRVGEALELAAFTSGQTEGAMGALAKFLTGGWGIAFTAAISVAGALSTKLLETHDAAEMAKIGSDGLADAQGVLGKMFDLTSGKLEHQNDLLRLNAQLTATNLRAEAAKERTDSAKTFTSGQHGSFLTEGLNAMAIDARGQAVLSLFGLSDVRNSRNDSERGIAQLIGKLQDGKITPEAAIKASEKLDYHGAGITADQLRQAIVDATSSKFKDRTADEIEKTLASGKLSPDLRNDPREKRARKPKEDHTIEREADRDRAYQDQVRSATAAYAKALLALSDTAERRYDVSVQGLRDDLTQRNLALDDQVTAKKITAAEAMRLRVLYGLAEQAGEEKALRDKQIAILDRQAKVQQDALKDQIEIIDAQMDVATGRKAKRDLAMKALSDDEAGQRSEPQSIVSNPTLYPPDQVSDAKSKLGQIDAMHPLRVAQINQQYASPMDQYRQQLKDNVGDMNDALDGLKVDAFKGLEDGLAGLITGTKSAKEAFRDLAASTIADTAVFRMEKAT